MTVDSREAPVVDIASFRKKKETAAELTKPGRNPLYVSHLTGKATGTPNGQDKQDFGDRLQRIRGSLDKINRLMEELKSMARDEKK